MGTTTTNLALYKPTLGESGWHNLVNANFDTLDRVSTFDVRTYGASAGGSAATNTTAIQAAIDAAATAGGGIVFFPPGTFQINSTLTIIDKPDVVLRGSGATHEPYTNVGGVGTILSWTGSADATMISVGASSGATSYARGTGVQDITIDGVDSAGTGLLITSGWWGIYRNLHIKRCKAVHLDITTIAGPSAAIGEDTQGNLFHQVSTRCTAGASASSVGFRLAAGGTPQAGQGNTSLNDFADIQIGHYNGIGIQIFDADSNRFFSVVTHSQGGTGIGLELNGSAVTNYGHARSNVFYFYDPTGSTGGIVARATALTQPAANNRFINMNLENNVAFVPTIETGASLYWATNSGNTENSTLNRDTGRGVAVWARRPRRRTRADVSSTSKEQPPRSRS